VSTSEAADWSPEARRATFVGLVETYHGDLVRLAYAICGDKDLAADAAQSAWQAAWAQAGTLRDLQAVRPWLLSITANQARRLTRRRQLGRLLELRAFRLPTAETQGTDLDLSAALNRLPVRDRQILALRFGLGLSSDEISPQVGLSPSGVRVRLARVLAHLRQELRDG
jgi:RNA polymerase sigma factor (sigma-70 family)